MKIPAGCVILFASRGGAQQSTSSTDYISSTSFTSSTDYISSTSFTSSTDYISSTASTDATSTTTYTGSTPSPTSLKDIKDFDYVGHGTCEDESASSYDSLIFSGTANPSDCARTCYGLGSVYNLVGFNRIDNGDCLCNYEDGKLPDLLPEVTQEASRNESVTGTGPVKGTDTSFLDWECYSHNFFQVDYTLDYAGVSSNFLDASSPDVVFYFDMAKGRQYQVNYFKEDCTTPADVPFPGRFDYREAYNDSLEYVHINQDLPKGIDASNLWDDTNKLLKFCMVVKNDVEISKVVVTVSTDMEAEFELVDAFSLGTVDASQVAEVADYSNSLEVCICSIETFECLDSPLITPDEDLVACFKPSPDSDVGIDYLKNLELEQQGENSGPITYVAGGLVADAAAAFTSIEYPTGPMSVHTIVLKTRVPQTLFDYGSDFPSVDVSGTVVMNYARRRDLAYVTEYAPDSRELQPDTTAPSETDGEGTAGFKLSVALDGSVLLDISSATASLAKNKFLTVLLGLASALACSIM